MTRRAALVLAGGEASRFQTPNQPWTDKALAQVDGKPLLIKVISSLSGVVDEVAVCVNTVQRQDIYRKILQEHRVEGVQFVLDAESPVHGPLLAIASGLQAVEADICLTVPVDMPYIFPKVASYLLNAAADYDVAVPMWPNGTLETLLMSFKRPFAAPVSEALLSAGKANADAIARAAGKLLLISPIKQVVALDPDLESFININMHVDLEVPPMRSKVGKVADDVVFDWGMLDLEWVKRFRDGLRMLSAGDLEGADGVLDDCARYFGDRKMPFWSAINREKQALCEKNSAPPFLRAAMRYDFEASHYYSKGCTVLQKRAENDAEWCRSQVKA